MLLIEDDDTYLEKEQQEEKGFECFVSGGNKVRKGLCTAAIEDDDTYLKKTAVRRKNL